MKRTIILLLAFVISGCASSNFYKDGTTRSQLERDTAECEYLVDQSFSYQNQGGGAGAAIGFLIGRAMAKPDRIKQCMSSRGYSKEQ